MPTDLTDKQVDSYAESVNSVHYFVALPLGLNDDAVNQQYLGKVQIKGKTYHKVQISFIEDGGGVDFEDVFIYWFNETNYRLEYLAYQYHVNGGGIRFRQAINSRRVSGVLFHDYINYKADHKQVLLADTDALFEAGRLEELSRIITENVSIAVTEVQ